MKYTKETLNETVWVHPNTLNSSRIWWTVDAQWKTLGKLAVEIARKLSGKDKPHYCDQWDCGDYVVVINTSGIVTTGNKTTDKVYYKHTGWKGHLREITLGKLMEKDANKVLELAVKWMLPKNKMRKPRLKRLKLHTSTTHNFAGHALVTFDVKQTKKANKQK